MRIAAFRTRFRRLWKEYLGGLIMLGLLFVPLLYLQFHELILGSGAFDRSPSCSMLRPSLVPAHADLREEGDESRRRCYWRIAPEEELKLLLEREKATLDKGAIELARHSLKSGRETAAQFPGNRVGDEPGFGPGAYYVDRISSYDIRFRVSNLVVELRYSGPGEGEDRRERRGWAVRAAAEVRDALERMS